MKHSKGTGSNRTQLVIFYILMYVIFYGMLLAISALLSYMGVSIHSYPAAGLALWGVPLLLSLAACFVLSRKYEGGFSFSLLGLRRKGFLITYLISSAAGLASMLMLLGEMKVEGFGAVASSIMKAGLVYKPLYLAVPYTLAIFVSLGFLAYSIWMAYPLRLIFKNKQRNRRLMLIAIVILWIVLFDQTLVTAQIEPVDLIIFDILFVFLFLRFGNAYGLVAGYLVSGEWVLMAIPASMGQSVFDYVLYIRMAIAIVSLAVLAFFYLSGKRGIFSKAEYL